MGASELVRERLGELAAALTARGLGVRVDERGGRITARNAAAETDDPRGRAMNPGLSQDVVLSVHDDESLHWYWAWTGARRGAPAEYEYLCPAEEIETAAAKVAAVLRLAEPLGS